ncbi:MAG: SMC-Scp complex subunit ScpB [Acidobacteria bacterium]|nr:SMC-Scp complex subunit ScpB [Acidobacteriota bacterium]
MSLKAKIEAVIYASEEPVTLAQLTGLLGEEGQAELDDIASRQQSLAMSSQTADEDTAQPEEQAGDADALNAETTDPERVTESSSDSTLPSSNNFGRSDSESAPDEAKKPARDTAAETKLRERKLREYFRYLLDQLIADYANGDRGLEIREVAGGFRLGTKAEYHDAVRGFVKSLKPPLKLTLQALETLAVVAYKQPITAPEVSEIRGVDSGGVLGSLLTRKLVTTAGRKQVIGRPILYKTTKDFLLRFGLKDINELPSIEEFEKMASELNEAVQEEIPMETHQDPANASSDSFHETTEDRMSDQSTHPEGVRREHADKGEVNPLAETHSVQADGIPDEDA